MKHKLAMLLLLLGVLLSCYGFGCEDDDELTNDPTLDLWCGDKLCSSWDTTGKILRVGTWHSADFGVELASQGASLSQSNMQEDSELNCIRFSVLGDWDEDAKLTLLLDYGDDGVVDWSERLPARHWTRWQQTVHSSRWFQSFRMTLRREGARSVQLAEIRARKDVGSCERSVYDDYGDGGVPDAAF